tara:strand:+ start:103 stop:1173 length:1071 start_codon:yes stop_codon:yes gene_type:complete
MLMRKASELWARGTLGTFPVDGTPFRFHVEQNRVVPSRFVPISEGADLIPHNWLVLPDDTTDTVELSFGEVISNNAVLLQEHTEVQLGWTRDTRLSIWFGESFNRLAKKSATFVMSKWLDQVKEATRKNTETLLVDIPPEGIVKQVEGIEFPSTFMGVKITVRVGASLRFSSQKDETVEGRRFCKRLHVSTTMTWSASPTDDWLDLIEGWTMKKLLSNMGGGYKGEKKKKALVEAFILKFMTETKHDEHCSNSTWSPRMVRLLSAYGRGLPINRRLATLLLPLSVVVTVEGTDKEAKLLLADFGKPFEHALAGTYTLPGHPARENKLRRDCELWNSIFLGGARILVEVTPTTPTRW